MGCDSRHLIRKYIDSELDTREKAEFEKHIVACAECNKELSFYRELAEKARNISEIQPSQGMTQDIMERIEGSGYRAAAGGMIMKLRWTIAYVAAAAGVLVPLLGY